MRACEEIGGGNRGKELHQRSHQPGPASLVARTKTCTVVPMKILVKQQAIAPVRILLKLAVAAEDRPAAVVVALEDRCQAAGEFLRDFEQGHVPPGAGRAIHRERVSIIGVVAEEGRIRMAFTGIHTGPRQFEFPPNMPECDFAGR